MASFTLPQIQDNVDSWGPLKDFPLPTLLAEMEASQLESATKSSRLGRVCDFTASAKGNDRGRWGRSGYEQEEFTLVDTKPAPRPPGKGKGKARGKLGQGTAAYRAVWGTANDEPQMVNPKTGKPYVGQTPQNHLQTIKGSWPGKATKGSYAKGAKGALQKGKGFAKGKSKGKGKGKGGVREWSVEVDPEWEEKHELNLTSWYKLSLGMVGEHRNAREVEVEQSDVCWAGAVPVYEKSFDRITPKLDKALPKGDGAFYNVTARDDTVIQEVIQNGEADIAITDHCLAALMSAPRSQYSWDLIVTKVEDKLLIDTRQPFGTSPLDQLTVNETSPDPPSNEDKEALNAPGNLGREATTVNQQFVQMVMNAGAGKTALEQPHPFADEEDENPVGAYRYQKFVLPAVSDGAEHEDRPYTVVVRSEVDCALPGEGKPVYAACCALNEYVGSAATMKTGGWRQSLQTQPGAVLATELKNNSFKLARWTVKALVAGADVIKLGYVTRTLPTDAGKHRVLSVQTAKTKDFAQQMGITASNCWAIVRHVVHLLMDPELPQGKYLLIKEPQKPSLRVYEVPWEAFEEEDEEDWEGEGEEDKEDEGIDNVPRM